VDGKAVTVSRVQYKVKLQSGGTMLRAVKMLAGLALISGFVIAMVFAYNFSDTNNWPSTKGHVVESKITYIPRSGYYCLVKYIYLVDNVSYINEEQRHARPSNPIGGITYEDTLRFSNAYYRKGQTVCVHYSPWSPNNSVLR
jgi:hypothetical protein